MKVVLFCGGQGTRIRDYSEAIPKPMVPIGSRPILWHVMKYYAHHGHTEFIVCLGHKAEVVKQYFRNYDETVSNDFVLSKGGQKVDLLSSDIDDWEITFVDTGVSASIGERLCAVRPHLTGEEMFLANYSDGLSDLPLDDLVSDFRSSDAVASFVAVRSTQSFHVADVSENGLVRRIHPISDSGLWINGGFFAFTQEIYDYLRPGEDLVEEPFRRLIDDGKLHAHRYGGFWMAMDTFKDKQVLDNLHAEDRAPWEVWKRSSDRDA
jgi:glucose-1-phosphate cytidylyltransferase